MREKYFLVLIFVLHTALFSMQFKTISIQNSSQQKTKNDITIVFNEILPEGIWVYPHGMPYQEVYADAVSGEKALLVDYYHDDYCGIGLPFSPVNINEHMKEGAVSFHVKGKSGGETISIALGTKNKKLTVISQLDVGDYIKEITPNWQKVVIPFHDFAKTGMHWDGEKEVPVPMNYSHVTEVSFRTTPANRKEMSVFFDNIRFVKKGVETRALPEIDIITNDKRDDGVFFGIFAEGLEGNPDVIRATIEKRAGKKPAMIMWYIDWQMDFPYENCRKLYEAGYFPHIVWEPWHFGDMKVIKLKNILDGEHDEYIKRFGRKAGKLGYPVMIRWGHEMNANWYPWAAPLNGNDPETYIEAYKYVYNMTVKAGGTNIVWAWSPNNQSFPQDPGNTAKVYYPGDEYVDWIAPDGYNWGSSRSYSQWQTFSEVFFSIYKEIRDNFPQKPVLIGEFASAARGGDKAEWFDTMFEQIQKEFPNIKGWVWFNIRKEADWRFHSSFESTIAFRKNIRQDWILTSGKKMANYHKVYEPEPEELLSPYRNKPRKKIPFTKETPEKDDWEKTEAIVIDRYKEYVEKGQFLDGEKNDLKGAVKILWSKKAIYLNIELTDDVPFQNPYSDDQIWNGDCIELTFGLKQNAPVDRISYTEGDYQIGVNYTPSKVYAYNWTVKQVAQEIKISARKEEKNNVIIQIKIPWETFPFSYTPQKGDKILFNIALDDRDHKDSRETQMRWYGENNYQRQPAQWPVLIFD